MVDPGVGVGLGVITGVRVVNKVVIAWTVLEEGRVCIVVEDGVVIGVVDGVPVVVEAVDGVTVDVVGVVDGGVATLQTNTIISMFTTTSGEKQINLHSFCLNEHFH